MKNNLKVAERIFGIPPQTTMHCAVVDSTRTRHVQEKGREEMEHRSNHGLGIGAATALGITGAAAVAYTVLSEPKRQREVRKGLRKAIDDLNELVDDISDTVKNLQTPLK